MKAVLSASNPQSPQGYGCTTSTLGSMQEAMQVTMQKTMQEVTQKATLLNGIHNARMEELKDSKDDQKAPKPITSQS